MSPAPKRSRWLLGLTAAVLAAHLWLLGGPTHIRPAPSHSAPPSLLIRTVVSTPVAAHPTPLAAAVPARLEATPAAPARSARKARNPASIATVAAEARIADSGLAAAESLDGSALLGSRPAPNATVIVGQRTTNSQVAPVAGPPPTAALVAPSMRLHYKVTAYNKNQFWHASGELDWRHDGSRYEAKLEVSAPLLPTRTQHSTGTITAEGLAPIRFSDKARSEQAAHFERDKGKVSFSSNRPDAPLLEGAQDRLSVMLQLGALIAARPLKYQPADIIEIQTASTREAEPWLFVVEGEERLQLPGGSLTALKLTRNPRREFDQKVELWLSPSMAYVPIRLRLTQPNGDWVDQQWSSTDKS